MTAPCSAATLEGRPCRNHAYLDGLCGTHYAMRRRQALRRMAGKPALGALRTSGAQRALAALRRPAADADVWTITFHPDGWVETDATTDNPARLECRLAAFLEYVTEGPGVLHCLSGHCGTARHAA